MKKIGLILLLSCFQFACTEAEKTAVIKKLPKPSYTKVFNKIKVKKIFSYDHMLGGSCLPFSKGFMVFDALDSNCNHLKLKYYDLSGKLKKERELTAGQGPNDVLNMTFEFRQNDRLLFIDKNTYIKTIDPVDLSVSTVVKLDNIIDGYRSKFIFAQSSLTDIEYSNGRTITSFNNINPMKLDYFIISYDGDFNNLKILHEVKRKPPKGFQERTFNTREFFYDYTMLTFFQRNFTVDWKNGHIYFMVNCEDAEISRIDMEGKQLTRIELGINGSDFFMDKNKMDLWYEWASGGISNQLKFGKKNNYVYPKTAPVLRDINIIGDWLLVTSGQRNWETFENKVFVYQLPALQFLGSFYIPTGDWPSGLFGDVLASKRIIKKDDDLFIRSNCYRIEVK
jgi:hypothetical protein